MRGRKPLPTQLKVLNGNPGKRPLNEAEPEPTGAKPKCPSHLDKEAKKEWRRFTKLLDGMGILCIEDSSAIALYCETWSRYRDAQAKLAKYGTCIVAPKSGMPMQSPYLAIANKAQEQMTRLLVEFGLTPSSRSRVKATNAKPPVDQFTSFVQSKSKGA